MNAAVGYVIKPLLETARLREWLNAMGMSICYCVEPCKKKFGRTAVVSKHSIVYNVLYAFLPTVQLNFHYNIIFLASYLQVNQIK